ncbi:hypothetical protein NGB36_20295 [Streptomyces sp. RB6PN25]|uniref:Uncharacterized protein n=1 Tax=Streptomyces humicola TaxID=2953240 RepID=A0ABT1PYX4_9ACTN|nr:hypothetical protein [Streptomyces humicola]MCQ4082878.1 hypothetical protein [Streptomyces humicola]
MSLMVTLARAQAAAEGRAQPLATVGHRHLSQRPLVLVMLTTAGEVGAPLGALVGTDRDAPRLLVVPQPRDRQLRFAFLAELADAVLPYIESYEDAVETEPATRAREESEICADAPQLIVPNTTAIEYVRLLGRSTRFRRTAEDDPEEPYPAPERVPLLGRWLTHYGERARTPGSALLMAMTDLLSRHWATGQSALEDQHLGALLAWIDPPTGTNGAAAARLAEVARDEHGLLLSPPAGPPTDPVFDNRALAPAMARFDAARTAGADLGPAERAIRDLVAGQLRPTWDNVWRGIDLLRTLPPASRAGDRWKRDRWSFTGHRDRVRAGEPPQPKRDDAVTAAQKLAGREAAQARLEAQEALDDPLVMAGRRLAGEAFAGEVVEVEMAYSDGRRPMPRPLVSVVTGDRPRLEPGAKVYRVPPVAAVPSAQTAEFVAERDGALLLRLVSGMGRGKVPEPGSVPGQGDFVCWTLFEHAPHGGPELPDPQDIPWTHGGPPGSAPAAAAPDPVTAEDFL